MRILLAGGGTGGHVEPALATAEALRRRHPDAVLTLLGTARGLETRVVPARGFPLELVPPVPLPRALTPDLAAVPVRLLAAVRSAARVLDRTAAEVLVGYGGYVALPAYLAARVHRVPMVVHEANARAGLANRLGARLTPYVATAAPDPVLPHARRVGMPLHRSISGLDRAAARPAARSAFGLDPDAPVLLVSGGSQGARRLNEVVTAAAPALGSAGIQVLHLTGVAHADVVRAGVPESGGPAYRVLPFLAEMAPAYAAADLMLCRGGAMTCAELAAVGLPAIYVPLPIGNGEQQRNAQPVVNAGGGLLVDDADLEAGRLVADVTRLLGDPAALDAMGRAAASLGVRDGDERLADLIELAHAAAGRGAT